MSVEFNKILESSAVRSLIATIFFLAVLFLILAAAFTFRESTNNQKTPLVVGTAVFFVDVADSILERRRGLSGKDTLDKEEGMLFVFNSEDKRGIWMKEMNFAIDILWIDQEFKVVHIKERISPDTYPRIFISPRDSRYVLELSAGSASREDISVGDIVDFSL